MGVVGAKPTYDISHYLLAWQRGRLRRTVNPFPKGTLVRIQPLAPNFADVMKW